MKNEHNKFGYGLYNRDTGRLGLGVSKKIKYRYRPSTTISVLGSLL